MATRVGSLRRVTAAALSAVVVASLFIWSAPASNAIGTPTVTAPAIVPVLDLSKSGQDPGDFVISGFDPGDTVLVSIGFVNPPSGTSFALPTRTGLTAGYGYDLTNGSLTEASFTASQSDANTALAAMTVSTGATNGNVTIQVSATLSIPNVYYYPINKHFYEYVASSGVVATTAISQAASKYRYGKTGYIVSISSAGENTFISSRMNAPNIWIGGSDSASEGVWKWQGGPESGRQFWQGVANGYTTSFVDYTGSSVSYANWCTNEPNDWQNGSPGEDYSVTNWSSGTCWNDLESTNSGQVSGYVVEYDDTSGAYTGVGSASMTAQVITEVTATWSTPSNSGNYEQSFTLTLSKNASGIDAGDFSNVAASNPAVGCVFEPASSSATANVALSVKVYGCSSGNLKVKVAGGGLTFSNAALQDTSSGTVAISSTGATPSYPSITSSANASGSFGSAIDLGSMAIDASSCTVGNVKATVSTSGGTVHLTASGSASVSTNDASSVSVTGSVADVDSTLDSATLAPSGAGSTSVTTTLVPAVNSTIGSDTYLFNPTNGHYYLVTAPQTWSWRSAGSDATTRSFCGAGGYFGTLTTSDEYQFISQQALTSNLGSIWIGGQKVGGTWRWYPGPNGIADEAASAAYNQGSTPGSGPWQTGEPNGSGTDLQIWYNTGPYGWDDTSGSSEHRSLVEFGTNATFTAPSATTSVSVGTASRTLSFAITSYTKTFGDGTFNVSASPSAGGGTVTYSATGSACSVDISTGQVTIVGAGSCSVSAHIGATSNYDAADTTTPVTITVNQASRTISFSSTSYAKSYGDSGFTVTANPSAGGGTVSYSASGSACSVNSSTGEVTITDVGSCSISATVTSTTNYLSATTTTEAAVSVALGSRTLGFATTSYTKAYGDAPFSVTATPSLGSGTVTYSAAGNGCSVDASSGVVTITGVGTCTVNASISSVSPYDTASTTTPATISIALGHRTLTFASTSITKSFGDAPFTLVATPSVGDGAVTYSRSGSACNVNANSGEVTIVDTGSCEISASIAATALHEAKSTTTPVTIAVDFALRSVSFATTTYLVTYGDSPFTVSATPSVGGGAVTYAKTGSACAVNASTGEVTITGVGPCTVSAAVASTSRYAAATTSTDVTITIEPKTLSVSGMTAVSKTFDDTETAELDFSSAVLSGVINGDEVHVDTTNATGSFESSDVGNGVTVRSHNVGIVGADAGKYVLTEEPSASANITARALKVSVGSMRALVGGVLGAPALNGVGLQGDDAIDAATFSYEGIGDSSYGPSTIAPIIPGTYAIVPSAVVIANGRADNYSITFVSGVLTIEALAAQPPAKVDGSMPLPISIANGATYAVVSDGASEVETRVKRVVEKGKITLSSGDFTFTAQGLDGGEKPTKTEGSHGLTVPQGGHIVIDALGFQLGTTVEFYAIPNTRSRTMLYLGDSQVNRDGTTNTKFHLSRRIASGGYVLQANGVAPNGTERSVNIDLEITGEMFMKTRSAFYQGRSNEFSVDGRNRLNHLGERVPNWATSVEVTVVGVSVSLASGAENVQLAWKRAHKVSRALIARGLHGKYTVTTYITFYRTNDGKNLKPNLMPKKGKHGKPLTTVNVTYRAP